MGSIPLPALQIKTPEVEGVLDQYQKGLGVKALIDQQRLRGQQIQQNDQQMTAWQQDQRKQQAIQQAIEAAGGDTEKAIPEIMKIDPKVGNEYREGFSKWRKSSDDEKISHLDLMQKQAEQVANIVSGVKPGDQQGWLSAVDTAHKQGLIDDDKYQVYASMPPDPAVLQGIQQAAMTVPQRLQAEKDKIAADRQAKIDKQTQDHNEKMERSARERDFQADYERQIAAGVIKRNAQTQLDYRRKWDKEQAELRRTGTAAGPASDLAPTDTLATNPESQSILAQTGLNLPAFMVLTGNMSQLSRDAATRTKASRDAQQWANSRGIDISTIASQYKAANETLQSNIQRMNNTKIMEDELQGTIQNMRDVVKDKDLGSLRFGNVLKVWAGQEVNDDLAQQYAQNLGQLRNELAGYYAATQGRSGSGITQGDYHEAENIIKNGISEGSLNGLQTSIEKSTGKMGGVMQRSVDSSRRQVWNLFGVGDKFKGSAPTAPPTNRKPLADIFGGK